MNNRKWTFISNHGQVFAYVAKYPQSTTQVMAHKIGLSIRAVQNILDDLEKEGFITRKKVGRNNRYLVHLEMTMRHRLAKRIAVGKMLVTLGVDDLRKTVSEQKTHGQILRNSVKRPSLVNRDNQSR